MRIVIYYIHCQNIYYTITVFLFQSNCLLATNFNFHIQLSMQPDGVTYDFQTLTIWEFIVWNIGGVWHQLAKIFALEKIIKIIGNKKKTIFIIAPNPPTSIRIDAPPEPNIGFHIFDEFFLQYENTKYCFSIVSIALYLLLILSDISQTTTYAFILLHTIFLYSLYCSAEVIVPYRYPTIELYCIVSRKFNCDGTIW